MIAEDHLGAETFLDFVLHRRQMGVLPASQPRFFPVFWPAFLQRADQFLGLPDIERLFQDALRRQFLFLRRSQSQNDLGMADRKPSIPHNACNAGASFKRRNALATTARLLPTLRAACSWVN
jgi:hypothetical protein